MATGATRGRGALTRQRSFRFPPRTLDMLTERAEASGESGNSLALRLLNEALHTDDHPLIHFRGGAAGDRSPALVGTRLYVLQAIQTLRASGNDVPEAARYFGISERQVHACVDYYADFKEEIDAEIAEQAEVARRERERWRRRQEALGEAPAR